MPSPKLVPLVLSDAERASLEALSRKRTASQALAERARVVLACAEEGGVAPLTRVAVRTGLSRESVRKWRVRFMDGRMDALADAPRPRAARTITDEQIEALVTRTTGPEFIGKVRDVVGLYMSPPEHALVLAVNEKSQIQALDRTAPCLPMLPTTPERRTHDYAPRTWTCTWCWTTTPPTRPRRLRTGWSGTRGSTCTSRPPVPPG